MPNSRVSTAKKLVSFYQSTSCITTNTANHPSSAHGAKRAAEQNTLLEPRFWQPGCAFHRTYLIDTKRSVKLTNHTASRLTREGGTQRRCNKRDSWSIRRSCKRTLVKTNVAIDRRGRVAHASVSDCGSIAISVALPSHSLVILGRNCELFFASFGAKESPGRLRTSRIVVGADSRHVTRKANALSARENRLERSRRAWWRRRRKKDHVRKSQQNKKKFEKKKEKKKPVQFCC